MDYFAKDIGPIDRAGEIELKFVSKRFRDGPLGNGQGGSILKREHDVNAGKRNALSPSVRTFGYPYIRRRIRDNFNP